MAELDSAGTQHGSDVDEKNDGQLYDMKRYFYLKNSETRDLVLDVEGMNRSPGAPVILWDQKFSTDHRPDTLLNQLWYEDTATSTIRTALNNFCLDRYGQSCSGTLICFKCCNINWRTFLSYARPTADG